MDAAEKADRRHRGIGVAEAEGTQRQTSCATIDLAQGSHFEAAAARGDYPLQFVEFVDARVFHRDDPGARRMRAGERIAQAATEYFLSCRQLASCTEFVIQMKTACNTRRLSFAHQPQPAGESIMKSLIDRLFSDIDRLFDDQWVVIWLLDDF